MRGICITVSIVEMGICAAHRKSGLVHEIHKLSDRPRHSFCDDICTIVRGKQHGAIEYITERELCSGLQLHGRRVCRNINCSRRDRDDHIQILDHRYSEITGHNLCGGSRKAEFIR